MAEIKIEEKRRKNLLPLVLGAILLLLLLGWCAMRDRGVGDGAAAGATNGPVRDFVTYVTTRDTTQETEANHQYTAGGVRRLAAALEAIAGEDVNIKVYADSMRSSVDRLQRSSDSDVHADDAKAAFSAAVSAIAQITQARGAQSDAGSMRAIYNDLSSQQPLVPQLSVVQRFFEAARDAVQGM
jgi:hypothetical protein